MEKQIKPKTTEIFLGEEIIKIAKDNKIRHYYDMNITQCPEVLVYTNFMNCLGGIYISSGSAIKSNNMIEKLIFGKKEDYVNVNYTQRIVDCLDDKYELEHVNFEVEKLVVLPGSNLLEEIVDDKALIRAACEGAYVKPHPMTAEEDIKYLKSLFGKKYINHLASGIDLMKSARKIYTTGTSEIFMYAIATGKIVEDISKILYVPKGGYQSIFKAVMSFKHYERPIVLNRILSHKESGIFFPFDIDQKDLEDFIINNFKGV